MRKQYPSGGDRGTSKLSTGQMVSKDHVNFEAIGTVDELNCVLGWVKCVCNDPQMRSRIDRLQSLLLDFGSHITGWGSAEFSDQPLARLEQEIDEWQKIVPDIRAFILPDGTELAARFHVARAVCRRAERTVALLTSHPVRPISPNATQFINRLSDWLFMAARWANVRAKVEETRWTPASSKSKV